MLLCENLPPSGVCESHSEPHLRHRQKKLNIILSYGLAVIKGALQGWVALGRHDKHFDTTASDSTVAKDKTKRRRCSPQVAQKELLLREQHTKEKHKKKEAGRRSADPVTRRTVCSVRFLRDVETHTQNGQLTQTSAELAFSPRPALQTHGVITPSRWNNWKTDRFSS